MSKQIAMFETGDKVRFVLRPIRLMTEAEAKAFQWCDAYDMAHYINHSEHGDKLKMLVRLGGKLKVVNFEKGVLEFPSKTLNVWFVE